ncbi:MAG: 2-isopropylmalate synthase [Pseudomonadales bacterium]|jgi:2-isopropylmalate synthase|uniref:2-isopropylmalate synthase n=1 Tax=unclassified Ketobacter TaxID=2639109 RepID=UPI000C96105A|nr:MULTISPECIES: 2-isopropylmalate synthase [unclassified Ketobacter]MAA60305.1 2-isopropylmalate synthase [Pseudomonadales bacterium]MEC8813990.1 2-isopropylmalate synthase [Pseudomonadota bacterium]HAG93232.1 2-isopropylmalate synthase [Gammaproteobacteria bacterium]MAQ24140.1 2-isopropylmalate synthase [Pseudomonadales bacterium]RLT87920.1 MAG: 2-isopropylmalate synthase [Ketobacter sp. GenoA1]|tara:strand:+ start:7139 stop:8803 length:1665 start_codon:yes stop_codon:yes gene_type:complete
MAFDHRKYAPYLPIQLTDRTWPDQVITQAPAWCSVDLRDGNQALIEPMSVAEKKRLFALLVKVGFKEIEVGFPAASQPDFDFVRAIIEEGMVPDDVTIQVLTQSRPELIKRSFDALQGARKAIVHLYNSTSPVQREQVFGLDKAGIVNIAVDGARLVKSAAEQHPHTQWQFQYSPESYSGTEPEFAAEVCNAVIDVWQPGPDNKVIINLPATVEMTTPNVYADQIEHFCRHVQQREHVIVSLHTHNDRGCGVAAAELGMMAGADRVEGTLLGNGERTGNMDIVTMAMNLYSRGVNPQLDLSAMDEIIAVVQDVTKIPLHPRHPYAGDLVYTAFSGSHQDAIRKCLSKRQPGDLWDVAYLPIDPADLGRDYEAVVRINSQSGKGGVAFVLEKDQGIILPRWMQIALSRVVQGDAEQSSGEISSQRVWALFQQHFMAQSPMSIKSYRLEHIENEQISFTVDYRGELVTIEAIGNGAISAFCNGLNQHFGLQLDVLDYEEHSLQHSSESQAAACVQINCLGSRHQGAAVHDDTLLASMNAIVSAVNAALAQQSTQVA